MTMTSTLSPQAIRPLLQSKIGEMDDLQVQQLHRVMLKLEAQRVWDEIKAFGARDRKEGLFNHLDQVIAEVRAEMASGRA